MSMFVALIEPPYQCFSRPLVESSVIRLVTCTGLGSARGRRHGPAAAITSICLRMMNRCLRRRGAIGSSGWNPALSLRSGLFDHLAGAGQQCRRHPQGERAGGLEIAHELEV